MANLRKTRPRKKPLLGPRGALRPGRRQCERRRGALCRTPHAHRRGQPRQRGDRGCFGARPAEGPVMKVAQFVATVPGSCCRRKWPRRSVDAAKQMRRRWVAGFRRGPPDGCARRIDWEKKFKRFDREAAAAASLGQVHARLARRQPRLACKLQYPNMGAAVDSDIRQFQGLWALGLQRSFDGTIDTREIGEEARSPAGRRTRLRARSGTHMRPPPRSCWTTDTISGGCPSAGSRAFDETASDDCSLLSNGRP